MSRVEKADERRAKALDAVSGATDPKDTAKMVMDALKNVQERETLAPRTGPDGKPLPMTPDEMMAEARAMVAAAMGQAPAAAAPTGADVPVFLR